MILNADIIPEYLMNLIALRYTSKHTGQFLKCF